MFCLPFYGSCNLGQGATILAVTCGILFDTHFTPYVKQETQLSMTNRATHLCKCKGLADLLEHIPPYVITPNLVVIAQNVYA